MPTMSSSWHRADTTKAQTHADFAEARAVAMDREPIRTLNSSGPVGISKVFQRPAGQERFEQIIRSIMESKGYRLAH